jgi:hypothetical protein
MAAPRPPLPSRFFRTSLPPSRFAASSAIARPSPVPAALLCRPR